MKKLLVCPLLLSSVLITAAWHPAAATDGAVIVYGLDSAFVPGDEKASEEAYQRLLHDDAVRYVCFQQIFGGSTSPLARVRAQELTQAGKRLVLQIWWGPGAPFPWSKYSFANIALDPDIREEFFHNVVDPCIDQFGEKNLYGVHLLEESGMQFGSDLPGRQDPNDFNFTVETSSYATPFWSGWGDVPGGVKIANVRRYEADFTRMTGFRFDDAKDWGVLQQHLFDRWVGQRLQSGGQVEFAKHIHAKYPGLKAFTWDLLDDGGNPRVDNRLEAAYFDGVVCDAYGSVYFNYEYQRALRLIFPKAEIINFAMGGMEAGQGYAYATEDRKRALALGAHMAGLDAVGFFETPPDFSRPASWEVNHKILHTLKSAAPFRKRAPLLLLASGIGDIYSATYAWNGLKDFDFMPTLEAHSMDFNDYEAIVLHVNKPTGDDLIFWNSKALENKYQLPGHVDYNALDHFVQHGGVLILPGQLLMDEKCPFFAPRLGFWQTQSEGWGPATPIAVSPTGWLHDKVGLRREYHFMANPVRLTYDNKRVKATNAGYFLRYGKGAVFYFPFNRFYDPQENYETPAWQDYRQLLSDVTRGVLRLMGKESAAEICLAAPGTGTGYMQATSDDGRMAATVLDNTQQLLQRPFVVAGKDMFTGVENPHLGPDATAVLTTVPVAPAAGQRSWRSTQNGQ